MAGSTSTWTDDGGSGRQSSPQSCAVTGRANMAARIAARAVERRTTMLHPLAVVLGPDGHLAVRSMVCARHNSTAPQAESTARTERAMNASRTLMVPPRPLLGLEPAARLGGSV